MFTFDRKLPSLSARPADTASAAHRPRERGMGKSREAAEFVQGHRRGRAARDDRARVAPVRNLNARAFTAGSNIFFGEGQYQPHTAQGRRLLAHELAHVVQQSRWNGSGEPRGLVQRTSVGEVLNEFFSPFSAETLWDMGPTDPYTVIVRNWQPVKDEIARAKTSIETQCTTWAGNHTSSGTFTPTMSDPPVWDPRAYVRSVRSPPGTDPDTCREHFIPYVASQGVRLIPPFFAMPPVETETLHTCAIGSFAVGITVDSIDCSAKTATMNVWMYNAMDTGSFGQFASNPAFALSGMERQYMWWHWTESHAWGTPAGGSTSGGWGGGGW
jgi:hypothetical protein